ncbi:MAG: CDP-alcohol phosphatidyltransferase family protein, partial [Gammaproteobacteria bacterium]|nr:CDP-alcohol phosphatidyltransferase family protein [Desulfobacterales bacterium]NIR25526.1 CDP-alcohol phosphatidyltransferase family protein [Gammaproteobacteria bacterium]
METDKRDRVLNLPNTLTAVRILLLPVFLWLLSQRNFMPALWVFAFSAITDLLDGYLARSWLEETRVGKILDPVADKLILISS